MYVSVKVKHLLLCTILTKLGIGFSFCKRRKYETSQKSLLWDSLCSVGSNGLPLRSEG